MNNDKIQPYREAFEAAVYQEQDIEFWFARELLGYPEWRNFLRVVEKAAEAAQHSEQSTEGHFAGVNHMVQLGSGAEREVEDIVLTRYTCSLIAQNGDPRKEVVAFAQSCFCFTNAQTGTH
jgi:DNA-damage-inducible protein D